MARQAPTYAAHIEAVRAQASEDAAAERRRLQSQLIHLEGEVHKLRELWQAEKQAKEGLLEVERIQVSCVAGQKHRGPRLVNLFDDDKLFGSKSPAVRQILEVGGTSSAMLVRPARLALSALLACRTCILSGWTAYANNGQAPSGTVLGLSCRSLQSALSPRQVGVGAPVP